MNEGKTQELTIESKLFKIPIDEYEKDMDTESAKGKKNEILDLLNNYSKLRSQLEFDQIKNKLHSACRKGDLDLIKICLSETIENDLKTLKFKINKANRTASLFKVGYTITEIVIPRTVKHESVEYLITSIYCTNQDLRILKFVENSEVETIYEHAFPYITAEISEIYFPASLKELKEEWCSNTRKLTKIAISPFNGQFKIQDNKSINSNKNSVK